MAMTVACKLPHGMTINHGGQTLNINGSNAYYNPATPDALLGNGVATEGENSVAGYGLTKLNDDQQAAFEDWRLTALYKQGKDGKPSKDEGLLEEPFTPLLNDTILTFKDDATARREVRGKAATPTGFDGIDGDAETKDAAAGSGLVDAGKQQ